MNANSHKTKESEKNSFCDASTEGSTLHDAVRDNASPVIVTYLFVQLIDHSRSNIPDYFSKIIFFIKLKHTVFRNVLVMKLDLKTLSKYVCVKTVLRTFWFLLLVPDLC